MVHAKRIGLYVLIVFALHTIIVSPSRAADLVEVGFEAISEAAKAVGDLMTQLVS